MWCGAEDATPFERVTLWETDEKTGAHTRKWDNECSVLRCINERLDPSAQVRCRPPAVPSYPNAAGRRASLVRL